MGLVQPTHFFANRLLKHSRQYGKFSLEVKRWPDNCFLQPMQRKHSRCQGLSWQVTPPVVMAQRQAKCRLITIDIYKCLYLKKCNFFEGLSVMVQSQNSREKVMRKHKDSVDVTLPSYMHSTGMQTAFQSRAHRSSRCLWG